MPLVIQVTLADDGNVSVGTTTPAPLFTIIGALQLAGHALVEQARAPRPLVQPAGALPRAPFPAGG